MQSSRKFLTSWKIAQLKFFVGTYIPGASIFKEIKHLNLTLVINPTHYSNGFMSGVNKAIKIPKCLNALAVMCWTKKVFSWFLWIRRADLEVNLWVTRWKENLGFNHLWDKNAHSEPFLCIVVKDPWHFGVIFKQMEWSHILETNVVPSMEID